MTDLSKMSREKLLAMYDDYNYPAIIDELARRLAAAEAKLASLPHTEDGHTILPGMTLFIANPIDWNRPDLTNDGRPILTRFNTNDYEVHPYYSRYKMFFDPEKAKADAEADRAAAQARKEHP